MIMDIRLPNIPAGWKQALIARVAPSKFTPVGKVNLSIEPAMLLPYAKSLLQEMEGQPAMMSTTSVFISFGMSVCLT